MKNNYIRTRTIEMWLGDDGIARIIALPNVLVELEDNKTNLSYLPDVFEHKSRPLYVDIRNVMWLQQLAREHIGSDEVARWINAVGFVVSSLASRTIGNLLLNFTQTPYPIRVFNSEKDAIIWLKEFIE